MVGLAVVFTPHIMVLYLLLLAYGEKRKYLTQFNDLELNDFQFRDHTDRENPFFFSYMFSNLQFP